MNIAIIVCTHGLAAEQLLKTSEMILGTQKNVSCINFLSNDNTETLIKKYNSCINKLNIKKGILFLVDTWGGSPFNAANQISLNKSNYEIITGVNIPMLIETFMARDDNINFQSLINIALKNGRDGIKALKTIENNEHISKKNTMNKRKKENKITIIDEKKHMNIILSRIDDRLIHGQVATCWAKETNVNRIIVINDEIAKNEIRKTLITQVAPPGVTAHVINIEKAIRVYNNPKYSNDRVMFLFTNPKDIISLIENGVNITSVNIGGMAFQKGKIQINNAVSVNKEDIESFKKLDEFGIELEVRKVPNDTPLKMIDIINKLINN